MAELAQRNLEQMLPFFNGLKEKIEDEKLKDIVRSRRDFEYKICSKSRNFNVFHSYIKYELRLLKYLEKSKIHGRGSLISLEKSLIKRLIKQITTHFGSEPKSFLLAIHALKMIKSATLEKSYWNQFVQNHGRKDPRIYLTAAERHLYAICSMDFQYIHKEVHEERLTIVRRLQQIRRTKDTEKIQRQQSLLEEIDGKIAVLRRQHFYNYLKSCRTFFNSGLVEFRDDFSLNREYLKFEIINWRHINGSEGHELEETFDEQDGKFVKFVIADICQRFNDVGLLSDVVSLVQQHCESLGTECLQELQQKLASLPAPTIVLEKMEVEETVKPKKTCDPYQEFLRKYRKNPRSIKSSSPSCAGSLFVGYLEGFHAKLLAGSLKAEQLVNVIKTIEWVLTDDDWSKNAVDVWWRYYMLEQTFGSQLRASQILEEAYRKLRPDLRSILTIRRIKEN